MLKLMPHRFKKIVLLITPIGFFLWIAMQIGWISIISMSIGLEDATPLNIFVAVLGLLSFLFGLYAISFSKEKIEDEMILNLRLESFRIAALIQIVLITLGLIIVGIMDSPPKDAGMLLFFITAIVIFWITYIIRFNYIIHFKIYRDEK